MDVLIDTNIFIHREDDDVVPEPLRELERSLKKADHSILVHPLSVREIRNDDKEERRRKAESRVETYVELSYPPSPSDSSTEFRQAVEKADTFNEQVDNNLLYAVLEDAVDFLVTEDREMHSKALDLGIEDRVFGIEEGRDFFQNDRSPVSGPVAIERTSFGELDLEDSIFDSLKEEYDGFTEWADSNPERPVWVNYCGDSIGAILVLKPDEVENIGRDPELGREKRLKISTLKVAEDRWGSKVGELLISIAIREAIAHDLEQIYLTHYIDEEDYLVTLVESYGFEHASDLDDGEAIFLKRLTPGPDDDPDLLELSQRFYPSFYDGPDVNKVLVPIRPKFHNKLFTAYGKRQPPIHEFVGEFDSEGNAIKKAYLTNSRSKRVNPGDILLFYRSGDHQEVTSIGVCEQIEYRLNDPEEIQKLVGKRSVFSEQEISAMAESPTTVILFSWHFDFPEPIGYDEMKREGVLSGPLQSMQVISEEDYKYLKLEGKVDERFARD